MLYWVMCFGVFVQLNDNVRWGRHHPIGYVIQENGCWDWVGATDPAGYGRWRYNGAVGYAHRRVYELTNGPIPKRRDLDHLCRRPICVNPDHLEPVTHRVNSLRGKMATRRRKVVARWRHNL